MKMCAWICLYTWYPQGQITVSPVVFHYRGAPKICSEEQAPHRAYSIPTCLYTRRSRGQVPVFLKSVFTLGVPEGRFSCFNHHHIPVLPNKPYNQLTNIPLPLSDARKLMTIYLFASNVHLWVLATTTSRSSIVKAPPQCNDADGITELLESALEGQAL